MNNILDKFECFVCEKIAQLSNGSYTNVANKRHYNCEAKIIMPKMELNEQNYASENDNYSSFVKQGKCTADLLYDFVVGNRTFTKEQFEAEKLKRFTENICEI